MRIIAATTVHRRAREAMATVFELLLTGANETYCDQAAQCCWERLETIEGALSRFREGSSISRLNQARQGEDLMLHPDAFACLLLAEEARLATGGAFDAAAGSRGQDSQPALFFYQGESAVRVEREDLRYDLGGIGKGYALDSLAQTLEEWELNRALLHGGGSSILALEPPDDSTDGWEVTLTGAQSIATLRLRKLSVSASGTAVRGEHILDPGTGKPAGMRSRIWCVAEHAAWSDAMSTAAFARRVTPNLKSPNDALVIEPSPDDAWTLYSPANARWMERLTFYSEAQTTP